VGAWSRKPRPRPAAADAVSRSKPRRLEAAWAVLLDVGFAKLTTEAVAACAGTGIAVLYWRWAKRTSWYWPRWNATGPATPSICRLAGAARRPAGSGMGEAWAPFFCVGAASAFAGQMADTGLTTADVRDRIIGEQRLARVKAIYQRAHDRGEIDLNRVPAVVLGLPFDLVRHDLITGLKPLSPALPLPLLASYEGRPGVQISREHRPQQN
jgi:AcrR family transcriptional regulator